MLFASLLRLCFPSWAFFDRAVAAPVLEARRVPGNAAPGPWEPVLRAPVRRWWHVLFNPVGTYTLAAQGQVERLHLSRLNEDEGPQASETTFMVVDQLVHAHIAAAWRAGAAGAWQWRIVAREGVHVSESVRHDVPS